jgi:hypothetical protein
MLDGTLPAGAWFFTATSLPQPTALVRACITVADSLDKSQQVPHPTTPHGTLPILLGLASRPL